MYFIAYLLFADCRRVDERAPPFWTARTRLLAEHAARRRPARHVRRCGDRGDARQDPALGVRSRARLVGGLAAEVTLASSSAIARSTPRVRMPMSFELS